MSKHYAAYFPVALALLFGLAISFIPASSVLGDNITACQGSGTPSSSLKLGGRTITPTLILQAASGTTCPAGETSLGLVSLSRTLIVSPVVTATTNGTALLAAMTLISNSNPSASNPWLLKLEPGNYDLGSGSLTLLPYVDLEGSGEDTTFISSSSGSITPTTGTLVAASNSEARLLTISNTGSSTYQIAVFIPASAGSTRITHLTASATKGTFSMGLYNYSGTATINNATFTASGSSSSNYGLYNFGGTVTINNSIFTVNGGTNNTYGLENDGGTVFLNNSTLNAVGSINNNYGFENGSGNSTITNSTLNASGNAFNYGLSSSNGTVTILNSTLTTSGHITNDGFAIFNGTSTIRDSVLSGVATAGFPISTGYGFYSNGGTSTITNSTLNGSGGSTSYGLNKSGGTALVFNSQLSGGTSATTGLSGTDCTYSLNANTHAALDANCH
jgi:hypothetical protein